MKKALLLSLFSMLLACERHEPLTQKDHLQQIQAQIDRKEYAQAEEQLQAILKAEPANERARVILASISVNKAGITLKDYFQLEEMARLGKSEPSGSVLDLGLLEKLGGSHNPRLEEALHFLAGLDVALSKSQKVFETFEKIPVVSDDSALHLQQALDELEKIEAPQAGTSFYRGIVKVFLFRHLWKTDKLLQLKSRKLCSRKVGELARILFFFQKFMVSMVRDVAQGFPKSNQRFLEQVEQFDVSFKSARVWLVGQRDVQSTVQQILEKTASENKIEGFKCDF